jgi:hypothetical protein
MGRRKTMSDAEKRAIIHLGITPIILVVALIIITAIAVGFFDWDKTIELKKDLEFDNYSKLFVNLFIITVIVERFIEVFNSIWRRSGRLELTREVENASTDENRINAQKELDIYRSRTQTLAMYSGFAIGITVGFSGIRTLEMIFDSKALSGAQGTLFQAIDIVLTAGLIAGGSKGINAITRIFGNFLESSKEKAALKPKTPSGG